MASSSETLLSIGAKNVTKGMGSTYRSHHDEGRGFISYSA